MEIHIEEIEDMVITILRGFNGQYPMDVTDRVFLAIEGDANKQKRYETFADGDYGTANQMIGRFIEDYTGLKVIGRSSNPKSRLIKSYSLLAKIGAKQEI